MNFIIKNQFAHISLLLLIFLSGCIKEKEPVVSTLSVSDITGNAAKGGGEVIDEGSSSVSNRGVCWGTVTSPTIADNVTYEGTGKGIFTCNMTGLDGKAVYYVRAFATNSAGTGYGDALPFTSEGQSPAVILTAVKNIGETSVTFTGSVNANFSSTSVSFEYGTTKDYGNSASVFQNPVTGGSASTVTAEINGLTSATKYHYRLKAVNAIGTTYSTDLTFSTVLSDVEGNIYNIITIGSQVWMKENLRTTKYRNGNLIGTTSVASLDITGELAPKYEWPCNISGYGLYYTYYAMTDTRAICPTGWHVPTDGEWTVLTDYLTNHGYGFRNDVSAIAKSLAATSGWVADATPGNVGNDQSANNSSGFTGFSTGGRYSNGVINFAGLHGIWWSSTESADNSAYFRCIGYIPGDVYRGIFKKSYGLPVRCVKD